MGWIIATEILLVILVLLIVMVIFLWKKIQYLKLVVKEINSVASRFIIKMALYDVFEENTKIEWIVDDVRLKEYVEAFKMIMLYKNSREMFFDFQRMGYKDADSGLLCKTNIEIPDDKNFFDNGLRNFVGKCAKRAYDYGYNQGQLVELVTPYSDNKPVN